MKWVNEKFGNLVVHWNLSMWLSVLALLYSAACMHVTLWEPVILLFLIVIMYLARMFAHIEGEQKYKLRHPTQGK